jgi:hypothetical protein
LLLPDPNLPLEWVHGLKVVRPSHLDQHAGRPDRGKACLLLGAAPDGLNLILLGFPDSRRDFLVLSAQALRAS